MPEQAQLIYLEPDDEITSVVRRLRAAEAASVVVVAPGRSRATSSAVALRMLAQVAGEEQRTLALVADAPTRALAAEAGITAFATVAEATSGEAPPDASQTSPRAPIRVVRGAAESAVVGAAGAASVASTAAPGPRAGSSDETVSVPLPPAPRPPGRAGRRGGRRWPFVAALLVVLLAVGAALLPGATVHIVPVTADIGPRTYQVSLPIAGHAADHLQAAQSGTATGEDLVKVAATGSVTFTNWNIAAAVAVPQGTSVSVGGGQAFGTAERIVVPAASVSGVTIVPSHASVAITALVEGLAGNVPADAIDTIDDRLVRGYLRGSASNKNRLVTNPEATTGGDETTHPVIQQSDVDSVVAAIRTDLASRLADALGGQPDRLYAPAPASEQPVIDVPPDLVGTQDTATFQLTGTLDYDRPYVLRADVAEAARTALANDRNAAPSGTTVLPDSIRVQIDGGTMAGDQMSASVSVRAAAAAAIDEAAVRDRIAGMTVADARAALADLGDVTVDLWPGWLDRLPALSFRISVETVSQGPAPSQNP
jgi:Baseplate J-like protein